MREVPLSKGKFAIVDDDDFDRVSEFKWSFTGNGYAIRGIGSRKNRKYQLLHRFIMGDPTGHIDHINGDGLDCRKSNMRVVTHAQNLRNQKTGRQISGRRGVYWDKCAAGYRVFDKSGGKVAYLGFSTDLRIAIGIRERFEASRPDLYPAQADANWKRFS